METIDDLKLQPDEYDVETYIEGDEEAKSSSFSDLANIPYGNLKKFVRGIRMIQDAELDNLIFVSGPKGVGKTTCSIQVAIALTKELGIEFDLQKHCAYNNDDVRKHILELQPRNPLVCDEAVRFAMAQDWASSENKQLMNFFAQIRTKKLCIFFNIPRMKWLFGKYGSMATWWIKIYARGKAVIFRPDLSEVDDPFHIKELQKLEKAYFFTTPTDSILARVQRHPCYFATMKYPPLHEAFEKKYLKLRNKRVFEDAKDEQTAVKSQKDIMKKVFWNLKYNGISIVNDLYEELQKRNYKQENKTLPVTLIRKYFCPDPFNPDDYMLSEMAISNWTNDIKKAMMFIERKKKESVDVVLPSLED